MLCCGFLVRLAAQTALLESEVVILDPHVTTAAISRTFGYHVFDTLFSMDSKGSIHPQMVDSVRTSGDKLTWDVNGGRVAVTTERPAFFRWEGYVKHGPRDVVKAVHQARKRRGHV